MTDTATSRTHEPATSRNRAGDKWTDQDERHYQAQTAQWAEHNLALREHRPERLIVDGVPVDTSTWFIC